MTCQSSFTPRVRPQNSRRTLHPPSGQHLQCPGKSSNRRFKAESFVATLKTECFGGEIPPTREIATRMIFDFIECFYNPHRRHSALGYVSPAQFEERLKAPFSKGCSGGGNPGGESDSKSRSALAAGVVDNAKALANALSKPPETTRNHTLRPIPIHPPSTQTITT
ncbi:MAG: IS3 family transposase [Verrucomicrobiota bacterium]